MYGRGLFQLLIDRVMTKIEKSFRAQQRGVAQVICTLRWVILPWCTKHYCIHRLQGRDDLYYQSRVMI